MIHSTYNDLLTHSPLGFSDKHLCGTVLARCAAMFVAYLTCSAECWNDRHLLSQLQSWNIYRFSSWRRSWHVRRHELTLGRGRACLWHADQREWKPVTETSYVIMKLRGESLSFFEFYKPKSPQEQSSRPLRYFFFLSSIQGLLPFQNMTSFQQKSSWSAVWTLKS